MGCRSREGGKPSYEIITMINFHRAPASARTTQDTSPVNSYYQEILYSILFITLKCYLAAQGVTDHPEPLDTADKPQ